jgi:hypothetical protein
VTPESNGKGRSVALSAASVAWWVAPSLICLALHWLAFRAWFRADDFAWFGLTPTVHNFHDLLAALFEPQAQGTIRTWSERAFFMAGYSLFGLNSLPYRIVIFATQFADLALVAWIGRRLTGIPAAGFWAAVFWAVSSSSMEPLGWACVYNEVMCGFFLLLAFYFLLRYIDTGERRFFVYQWIVFLLGFGALELNVVYPALAAGYTLLCARRHFRRTLPMFAASAVYAVAHTLAAPMPKSGDYAMHFGASMFRTLAILWSWTVGPTYHSTPLHVHRWVITAGIVLVSVAILCFAVRRWRSGLAPFFLLWYLVTIGPLLPLRDHITEYYVYLPAIGICWLGGWGMAQAWRSGAGPKAAAALMAVVYGFLQIPQLVASCEWNYNLTQRTRNLVEGVAGAREVHPGQAILLYGMDGELFWNALHSHPFRTLGIDRVYLAPGTAEKQKNDIAWEGVDEFILPGPTVTKALSQNGLVVYDVRGPQLRNMTTLYAALPQDNKLPTRIEGGDPLAADLFGPEWHAIDGDHRWMPKRATLKLRGPESANRKLHLRGNCADEQLSAGPLTVTVTVDGMKLPDAIIHPGEASFDLELPLPAELAGKPEVHIALEVSRTIRPPGDGRELGLAFGTIEIR